MRITIIGATGHVGTYLVPRLVEAGHQVVAVSRGQREPYTPHAAWEQVQRVSIDRTAAEADNTFVEQIVQLSPEVVIDMVCFTESSAAALVAGLRGNIGLLIHCGTIWTYGISPVAPLREDDPKEPFGEYGTRKRAIEKLLQDESSRGGLASTIIHPGHISGPGWNVINPVGNLDVSVWTKLATGEPLAIPGLGAETMHHVHADDVAQLFQLAVEQPDAAIGQSFNAVSERALSVRGFATLAAAWFDQKADLMSVSWQDFRAQTSQQYGDQSWDHLCRSQVASIEKAQRRLGYLPAYTSEQAAREAVSWLARAGTVDLGGHQL